MIKSLMLKERHKAEISSSGKTKVNGEVVQIKDIPFIRYRFSEYKETDIDYILDKVNKFKNSAHLLEVVIYDGFGGIFEKIVTELSCVASYIYIPVDNEVVENGFSSEQEELIQQCEGLPFDRIMILDNSDSLFARRANELKEQIAELTGDDAENIGICSSPLSVNGNQCLSAEKARELAAAYSCSERNALPSANHQDMQCCGCIRYEVVNEDMRAPAEKLKKPAKAVVKGEFDAMNTPADSSDKSGVSSETKEKPKKKPVKKRKCVRAW